MTVLEVIQRSTEFLTRKGVESPRLQVELLLAHVLKLPRLQLYLNFERKLTSAEIELLRAYVKRRGSREPLQYIVGSTSFCGYEIKVDTNVLIPRPETEVLAELGWQFLNGLKSDSTALDFGTGSGCIAIALAARSPTARVTAMEVSETALNLARANALRHQVADRIEFLCAGGFQSLPSERRFDLVISNPPYIPTREIETLAPEVREFEPRLALDGGEDGLNFIRQIAADSRDRLRAGGRLMLEFSDGQAPAIKGTLSEFGWTVEAIKNDLSGRPRIAVARRGEA